jgi:LytS/YehU family sensor histidine kinase
MNKIGRFKPELRMVLAATIVLSILVSMFSIFGTYAGAMDESSSPDYSDRKSVV